MRLKVLERGQRPIQRVALAVVGALSATDPDPVAKLSLYRPRFFGKPWMELAEQVMRGPSDWSEAERELLMTFVSRLNRCPFCVGVHDGTASLLLESTARVNDLDNWREAGFEPRIAETFALLEKVSDDPGSVGPDDIARVRRAGVSEDAIADALTVSFFANTINRLANAFDFRWATDRDRMKLASGLNRIRYHLPAFLLR